MAAPYKQVVLFGDSLFEFCSSAQNGFSFQGALQQRCMRGLDVVNRGLSYVLFLCLTRSLEQFEALSFALADISLYNTSRGYNTRDAVDVFPKVFLPPSPSIPRIEYLVITHDYIKQHNPKILLCAPPPLEQTTSFERDRMRYPDHPEPSRTAAQSAQYSEAARQVASEVPGVVLVDLQKLIMNKAISMTPDYAPKEPELGHPGNKSAALQELLPDGLHMSGLAYKVFFEEVIKHLDVPDPEDLEQVRKFMVHPGWRDCEL
ncbi:SGNH hydrolase-type esterase domain-containing protein [Xylariaceae sp. FL1019]|nr:SGNH hydrolase-type esterase domain-containing protein [Xylariaceae sp. FL1019]